MSNDAQWTLRGAVAEGWSAARHNARAILLIQALAVAVVVAYYAWPDFAKSLDALGPWRERWGLPLSFILGFLAGGVVPEIAKLATRQTRSFNVAEARETGFVGLVYGLLAIQIDLFYRLQVLLFGHGIDPWTIAKKLAVDMGIAAPLVFIPFTVGMFLWRERGFRLGALPSLFNWKTYRDRILTIQIANWFVWIPALAAVYALPLPLQFPLSTLVEACWSLLLVVMARPSPTLEPEVTSA